MFELRTYQNRALEEALAYINDQKATKKSLMIAPVGSGKSLYIAAIANALSCPILVLQPSKELLKQNYAKYVSYGNEASIYSASLKQKEIGHVTFATIKSIVKEVESFKALKIGLVLIDEAHLQTKHSSLTGHFLKALNCPKVIGLTATPIELRAGMNGSYLVMINRSKKNIFNDIIHITQVKEIVEGGFWAEFEYEKRKVVKDKLKLNSTGSDYTEQSMNQYYLENEMDDKIIQEVDRLRAMGKKSIIIFMPSICTAEALSTKIPRSMCVSSITTDAERDGTITAFKKQILDTVLNVNILSVGFDHPALDAIICVRPTKSFAIYYQQLGRGARPFTLPDGTKKKCRVIDFSGNVEEFGKIEEVEFKVYKDKIEMFSGKKKLTSNWGTIVSEKEKILDIVEEPVYIPPPKPKPTPIVIPEGADVMWYGSFKDKKISEIPTYYLKWLIKNLDPKKEKERMQKFLEIAKLYLEQLEDK